ncbi:DUF397 domain-containing protein [Nocardiopsis aegyptia]|uniref:DUF397 domain-containing protein n=1 Tax=Nocardiopsis aegyptia TaxID=220378 RepID=A0A7Z0EJ59_9ACTN|nr:DUF397 domain-containing protein [Nocardiopsis aegyptia]NYJ33082.1 hypothetical protein [Nocardiopsis aegyptia]
MKSEWSKSSYSPNTGNCVEARSATGGAQLRDSKYPRHATLVLPASEWTSLLATVVGCARG